MPDSDAKPFVPYIRRVLQEMGPKFDPPTDGFLAHKGIDTGALHAMGLNESLFPPSPRVVEAVRASAGRLNRYPDSQCPALTDIVSAREGVAPENIVWGNGSEELIVGTLDLSLGKGDGMVLPVPTFWGYRAMVMSREAECAYVGMNADGTMDVDGILGAVGNHTRLVNLVTPNNPSGAQLSREALRRLIEGVPENVLLAVDNAYHDFGVHAGGPDVVQEMKARRGPWIVIRTFSKAYAMAGMRIGFAMCSDGDLAQALRKTTCTFDVPILAQAAAEAAFADADYLADMLEKVAASRAEITEGLRALGLEPFPSVCNFVSARAPKRGKEIVEAMLERNVLIHAWPDPGYEDFIRITVGRPEDNAACLAALKDVLAG